VVPQKRIIIAAVSTVAATLVLAGCGTADYGLGSSTDTQNVGAASAVGEIESGTPAKAKAKTTDKKADDKATEDKATDDQAAAPKKKAALKPAGNLTDELIATTVPKMGNVVTDSKGWVLYRFDKDSSKPPKSACAGDCAKVWPPVLADKTLKLVGDLDGDTVGTVRRADGGLQVTIGNWPVYRYIGDKKPGQWKGQNVGGVWFVIDKAGKKNVTCLPPVSKAVKPPATKAKETTDTSTGY
jgi:predicted lipoprotein with Yx(FWY)xxD motif